jgi:hypothetical protein
MDLWKCKRRKNQGSARIVLVNIRETAPSLVSVRRSLSVQVTSATRICTQTSRLNICHYRLAYEIFRICICPWRTATVTYWLLHFMYVPSDFPRNGQSGKLKYAAFHASPFMNYCHSSIRRYTTFVPEELSLSNPRICKIMFYSASVGSCECGNEPLGSIKCGEFLD